MVDEASGTVMPTDWDPDNPWAACFRALTKDEAYWIEQVKHPAMSWMVAVRRGAPSAAAEAIADAHFVGGDHGPGHGESEAADRKKQANKNKRLAKKKYFQEQNEEPQRLKAARRTDATSESGKKGMGRGKLGLGFRVPCFPF